MGKKAVSIVLCIALIAAAACAVVFKNEANTRASDLTAAQDAATAAQADLAAAQADLTAANETIASLEAAAAQAASAEDLAAAQAEAERLQNAYDLQKSYVVNLEKRATELLTAKAEIDVLKAQLAAAEGDAGDAADTAALEAEVARLQNAYDLQKSYVVNLEKRATELLTAKAEIDVLKAQLAAEGDADDTADTAALEAEVAHLQNAYDLQKSYVVNLEKRATELLTAKAEIDVLKAQLAAAEGDAGDTADTAALEAEVARLQGAYDLQKSYVAKLEKRATDLLGAQAEIDVLKAQLAAAQTADVAPAAPDAAEAADTAALEAEVARLQGAYDLQKSYVAKLEKRASDLLVAQATIDELNAKLAALTAEE